MEEDDSALTAVGSTALNAYQALGRGFDVTCDIRIVYCKGTAGSRLVEIDEEHTRDLELPGGQCLPNVSKDIKCAAGQITPVSTGVLNFEQMVMFFNEIIAIPGKTPSGWFNAMFSFSGSWQTDALATKSLALNGWVIALYSLNLAKLSQTLCGEVKQAVPSTWDPSALASFIEKYGTHIVSSVSVGGKDIIYVKQHQSSPLSATEIQLYLKELGNLRFSNSDMHTGLETKQKIADQALFSNQQISPQPFSADASSSLTGKEDVTVIYRRRGGDDLVQNHDEWKVTVYANPDIITMSFIPITSLLEDGPGKDYLKRAIDVYLEYKPPIEELQYFLQFQVPVAWAPIPSEVGFPKKEPVCPTLQFSLMGPKLSINTAQVSVGRRPVIGLRLSLEGKNCRRLAIHILHLVSLPKILQPHWDAYVAIGAPKWHGPEEQDSRWFEPVLWKNFSHVSTAPIEFSETWIGDTSGAFIVTGAQLGVWDFGVKNVLYLRLLYSKVPGCAIRRSVWDHTPTSLNQQSKVRPDVLPTTSQVSKLLKFVDTTE
eukprot:c23104_g1_i1 orf=595-2220(+)